MPRHAFHTIQTRGRPRPEAATRRLGKTPTSLRTLVASRQQEAIAQRLKQNEEVLKRNEGLLQRVEKLEARIGRNSQDSKRPPSSDTRHQREKRKEVKDKKKPGAKKGHQAHKKALLEPTETVPVPPAACLGGCWEFVGLTCRCRTFHMRQPIELPESTMEVTHFLPRDGEWGPCGAIVKASASEGSATGQAPRLTALVRKLSGVSRSSRRAVKDFCQSVLGLSTSVGAIEVCRSRSQAMVPYCRLSENAFWCVIEEK